MKKEPNSSSTEINNELLRITDNKGLELLIKVAKSFSDHYGTTVSYEIDLLIKAGGLNIKNPILARNYFWPIDNTASLKNSIMHSLLVEREALIEPVETIKDAEICYYYYNLELKDILKKYVEYVHNNKSLQPLDKDFIEKVMKVNLQIKKLGDDYKKSNIPIILGHINNKPIYERVTILSGKRLLPNGNIFKETVEYKLSTAINLGIYLTKNGEIKKAWHNIENMMYKRCLDGLVLKLALSPELTSLFDTEASFTGRDDDDDINFKDTEKIETVVINTENNNK